MLQEMGVKNKFKTRSLWLKYTLPLVIVKNLFHVYRNTILMLYSNKFV